MINATDSGRQIEIIPTKETNNKAAKMYDAKQPQK